MLRKAGDILGRVDDAVQGSIRKAIIGDDSQRGNAGMVREIAEMPFLGRPAAEGTAYKFTDNTEGRAAMLAARSLQAGAVAGVTAAGKGLYDLTSAMFSEQTSGTVMPQ